MDALPEYMSSPQILVGFVLRNLVYSVLISLHVLLSLFCWPLHCLSVDLRLLITPLVIFPVNARWAIFQVCAIRERDGSLQRANKGLLLMNWLTTDVSSTNWGEGSNTLTIKPKTYLQAVETHNLVIDQIMIPTTKH